MHQSASECMPRGVSTSAMIHTSASEQMRWLKWEGGLEREGIFPNGGTPLSHHQQQEFSPTPRILGHPLDIMDRRGDLEVYHS